MADENAQKAVKAREKGNALYKQGKLSLGTSNVHPYPSEEDCISKQNA